MARGKAGALAVDDMDADDDAGGWGEDDIVLDEVKA